MVWMIPAQVHATEDEAVTVTEEIETQVAGDISSDFTDSVFKEFVVTTYGDGTSVTAADLASVVNLNINGVGINSLDGIQHFTSLDKLLANENNFPTVNLSELPTTVKTAQFITCNVEVINTVGGENLEHLSVSDNPLSTIDFSNLTNLKTINAANMPNLETVDLTGAPNLENVTFAETKITSLDLTGLTLKGVIISDSPITDFKMDAGQRLSAFWFYNTQIETFDNPPASVQWLDGTEQAPRKEVVVLADGSKQITLADTSTPDESTIEFGGVYDAATHTITWPSDVLVREIVTQNITFSWTINTLSLLSGTYVLEGELEPIPSTIHTVNFYDCDGNLVGQDWPQDGANATAPNGYTYATADLVNITQSKDVNPLNCSGGFLIPNTATK